MEIQPQHLTLAELVHGRLFRVPQYQKAYSWGSRQRRALFEDIARTWESGNDRRHFMATIVGLRREKRTIIVDEHQVIEIVDGQQRITTLVLLLKSIAKILDRTNQIEERIGQDIDETLVKPDEASLLLLQTNHDLSNYFADYLRQGSHPPSESATTLADRELLLAIEECEKFVVDWQNQGRLTDLVALLRNRLTFIFHEISDHALVYTVFEVLNSRGLEVSWVDRLKSMLMAIVFESDTGNRDELIQETHRLWSEIYRCIGLRQGMSTEALRFAATLRQPNRPNRPLGQADAVKLLSDQSAEGPAGVIQTTDWLKSVTEAVDQLARDRRRNAVTQIAHARLLATAVHLRQDLSERDKAEVIQAWEGITFRIYGLFGRDARWAVGDYVRLAWRILKEKLPCNDIVRQISRIGEGHSIKEAAQNIQGQDCYNYWGEELRYLLFRYEESLAKKAGQKFDNEQWNRIWEASAADSIEHILPQQSGDDEYMHRLGNLIILPPKLNSQLGSKSPKEKGDSYLKTGLLQAQEVVPSLSNWGRKAIEEREKKILDWVVTEWSG